MAYTVVLTPAAARELKKYPDAIKEQFAVIINSLSENPRPLGCIKLHGRDEYRIRLNFSFRLIYLIQDNKLLVTVIKIGHRREVYK